MTSYHTNNSIIRSWLKLFHSVAKNRGVEIQFPPQLWHFTIDSDNFTPGRVRVAKRENYGDDNKNRIFFGCEQELQHEEHFSSGAPISVILDIYSSSGKFEPELDHFIFVDADLRHDLPGSNDRPSIYLMDHKSGGEYYYCPYTNSNKRRFIEANNWDIFFENYCEN